MDKRFQEVLAEQSQGHGLGKHLHIRGALHMKEQREGERD